jgi:hypothetical protein
MSMTTRRSSEEAALVPARKTGLMAADTPAMKEWAAELCPSMPAASTGWPGNVISLYAKGMTTGDIQTHLLKIYGTDISRETISKITDRVVEG